MMKSKLKTYSKSQKVVECNEDIFGDDKKKRNLESSPIPQSSEPESKLVFKPLSGDKENCESADTEGVAARPKRSARIHRKVVLYSSLNENSEPEEREESGKTRRKAPTSASTRSKRGGSGALKKTQSVNNLAEVVSAHKLKTIVKKTSENKKATEAKLKQQVNHYMRDQEAAAAKILLSDSDAIILEDDSDDELKENAFEAISNEAEELKRSAASREAKALTEEVKETEQQTKANASSEKHPPSKATRPQRKARVDKTIDCHNDQINQLEANNRRKYMASTSTPAGCRRKQLKLPKDISIIIQPENPKK